MWLLLSSPRLSRTRYVSLRSSGAPGPPSVECKVLQLWYQLQSPSVPTETKLHCLHEAQRAMQSSAPQMRHDPRCAEVPSQLLLWSNVVVPQFPGCGCSQFSGMSLARQTRVGEDKGAGTASGQRTRKGQAKFIFRASLRGPLP